ncbi:hypothetical protein SCD_n00271 [Sulfuricella denitrificans skB26]|uniref:Uncharacterized protein n=1 Tax=Sulfuricella denitrificans (strain DSM 22764 / NBRC 105220 / skB26) TaxID=1163617 RepID=S6A9H5_SULDS|nr:hypothetical protein [Sulfuricella denitrificans]BAN34120.1 hypothetical protein SCD_n00271 [Sulfuricella denitrificans skB26]
MSAQIDEIDLVSGIGARVFSCALPESKLAEEYVCEHEILTYIQTVMGALAVPVRKHDLDHPGCDEQSGPV